MNNCRGVESVMDRSYSNRIKQHLDHWGSTRKHRPQRVRYNTHSKQIEKKLYSFVVY